MKNYILPLLALVLIGTGCAKMYYSPDSYELAAEHKVFAIIPPRVSIAPSKKIDGAALIEQQKTEAISFQQEIHAWMLRRISQGRMTQQVQDLTTTNAILKRVGYENGTLTVEALCDSLGVDAILESHFALAKPMSDGGAIALAVLTGVYGSTNQVTASLYLKDCSEEKLIWSYNHKISAGLGSTPASVVDQLMGQATRKMPYVY